MELIIFIEDKEKTGDVVVDAKRWSAGDVIAAMPDDHPWSRKEMENPAWRILRVPGMTQAQATALCATEISRSLQPIWLLRFRQISIDITSLDAMEGGTILLPRTGDVSRRHDVVVQLENLMACQSLKSPISDPRIIGPVRGVIG